MTRNATLDYLKLALTFMVVGIHTSVFVGLNPLLEFLSVNGLFRFAVPIFLLINGYHFYSATQKMGAWPWINRIAILYLFWMTFYLWFWIRPYDNESSYILQITSNIVFGYYHLWYIAGLLGAVLLLIPLAQLSTNLLSALIILLYGIGVVLQYIDNYSLFANFGFNKYSYLNWIHRNFLFFSFPFFCVGFLLNKHQVAERLSASKLGWMCVFGTLLFFTEAISNYLSPKMHGSFDNYLSLIIACPLVFLYCLKSRLEGQTKIISLYASAIFFLHPLIKLFLSKAGIAEGLLMFVLTLGGATIAAFILLRIKMLAKYVV